MFDYDCIEPVKSTSSELTKHELQMRIRRNPTEPEKVERKLVCTIF